MAYYTYHDSGLFVEQVSLFDVAESFGTPAYVYSRQAIEDNYDAYAAALAGHDHLICYAVKANSNLAILNLLARRGSGFDIVSGGELARVIEAGGDPAKVVFSGVAKTTQEIQYALEVGIHCFNVESEAELERINEIACIHGCVAPISLRVNPDVDANTHPYISTGLKENKFGVDILEAPRLYRKAADMPGLRIVGVDCHIGSQLTETRPFIDALERVLSLIDQLSAQGIQIEHLDIGGGLGVRYNDETPPSPQQYLGEVLARLGDRPLKVLVEPGRSIVANAGVLLTRVEYLKENQGKHFAIVDAAMNDLLRPSLYRAWMDIAPVTPRANVPVQPYDIVGPVCETGDFLGKDRALALAAGDLLVVHGAGAYGFSMASNYNSRGRAAEILVDGEQSHLVRTRETFSDLIRGESVLP